MSKIHIVNDYYPEPVTGSTDMPHILLRRMQELSDQVDFCLLYARKYDIIIDTSTRLVFDQLKRNISVLSKKIS